MIRMFPARSVSARRLVVVVAAGMTVALSAGVAHADSVVGRGTPSSCTSAAVVAAVRAGGTIRFSCGRRPVTILMRATAEVLNTSPRVVLDGGGRVTLSGGGVRRILYMNTCDPHQVWTTSHCEDQATPELVVEGLTFERGLAPGATPAGDAGEVAGGGAIYAFGGELRIEDSSFLGDRCTPTSGLAEGAGSGGGAVAAAWQDAGAPVEISHSHFRDDVCDSPGAAGGGGAVFATQGRLRIEHSTFTDDRCVHDGPDVGGGAVRAFVERPSAVTVSDSTFASNVCSNGAALSSIAVSWTLDHDTFTDNHAIGIGANPARPGTPGGGSGGAIYNDGDAMTLSVDDSALSGNTATEGGGAIFFVSDDRTGTMSITGSRLVDNPNAGFQTASLPGIFFLGARPPAISRSVLR